MKDALRVIGWSFRDVWDDLWTNLVINLLWFCFQLLVITGPPATMGLFNYSNRIAHGEVTDFSDFWGAMRRYFIPAWRWALLNYVVLALLAGDYALTGQLSHGNITRILQGFYLALLAAWLLVQLYALPFLLEQDTPGVLQALRNGAVMLGRNIRFSVVFGLLLGLALLLGIPVFMLSVAFGGVLTALAGNQAVLNRIEVYRAGEPFVVEQDITEELEHHRSSGSLLNPNQARCSKRTDFTDLTNTNRGG